MEEQLRLQIIEMLHGYITSREDAPTNYDEFERTRTLEIFPEYKNGLAGIDAGQTP